MDQMDQIDWLSVAIWLVKDLWRTCHALVKDLSGTCEGLNWSNWSSLSIKWIKLIDWVLPSVATWGAVGVTERSENTEISGSGKKPKIANSQLHFCCLDVKLNSVTYLDVISLILDFHINTTLKTTIFLNFLKIFDFENFKKYFIFWIFIKTQPQNIYLAPSGPILGA